MTSRYGSTPRTLSFYGAREATRKLFSLKKPPLSYVGERTLVSYRRTRISASDVMFAMSSDGQGIIRASDDTAEKTPKDEDECDLVVLQETIYDLIRDVKDPEKEETLEELNVIYEEGVEVRRLATGQLLISIEFTPTVPHCSLASLIGLSLRTKLLQCLPEKHKLDIFIKKGTHSTEDDINKQINDKERIAAAMENPNLQKLIKECIQDREGT